MSMKKKKRRKSRRKETSQGTRVSIDDAVRLAVKLHQEKQFDQAETIYQQILEKLPTHPDALHFLGILKHQRGFSDEAAILIRKSITQNPGYADAFNNLGNVLKESGRSAEAEEAYRSCLKLSPRNAHALNNLGTVLKDQRKYQDALSAFRQAIDLMPENADTYHNIGNTLKKLDRIDEAILAYRKSIALHPYDADAYKSLGRALYQEQHIEEAIGVFEQWLSFDPENATARHMLAACTGKDIPAQASSAFIKETFDKFAGNFDDILHRLEYRAPELVLKALENRIPNPAANLEILDAGCGTGLCAPLVRPYASHLTGVDLSQGMVEKARGRRAYDNLVVADLTEFMQGHTEAYDLIISADTLCYFGDLEHVLQTAH
jgi:predicted TPR repeat methyltransferase